MRPLLLTAALVAVLGTSGGARSATPTTPLSIRDQTAGVTSKGKVAVAVFCHAKPCKGKMKLGRQDTKFASATFEIPPTTTFKVKMLLTRAALDRLRSSPERRMKANATATLEGGRVVSHLITLAAGGAADSTTTPTTPLSINDQTDGVTSKRKTTIAVYCRKDPCKGKMKLGDGDTTFASAAFEIPPKTTYKIKMRLSNAAFDLLRSSPKRKMKVRATATLQSGQVVSHLITLKA